MSNVQIFQRFQNVKVNLCNFLEVWEKILLKQRKILDAVFAKLQKYIYVSICETSEEMFRNFVNVCGRISLADFRIRFMENIYKNLERNDRKKLK